MKQNFKSKCNRNAACCRYLENFPDLKIASVLLVPTRKDGVLNNVLYCQISGSFQSSSTRWAFVTTCFDLLIAVWAQRMPVSTNINFRREAVHANWAFQLRLDRLAATLYFWFCPTGLHSSLIIAGCILFILLPKYSLHVRRLNVRIRDAGTSRVFDNE